MDQIVLSLRECSDGWRVFNGQQPLFWLPDYEEAMATALTVASVHVDIREVAASIELQMLGEAPVQVTRLAPNGLGARLEPRPTR